MDSSHLGHHQFVDVFFVQTRFHVLAILFLQKENFKEKKTSNYWTEKIYSNKKKSYSINGKSFSFCGWKHYFKIIWSILRLKQKIYFKMHLNFVICKATYWICYHHNAEKALYIWYKALKSGASLSCHFMFTL